MSEQTIRYALPYLDTGQAQKELTHNEALALIDLLLHAAVEDFLVNTPPGDPALGSCWIVGTTATGDWAGQTEKLASWTSGGWRFVTPHEGMTVWSKADGVFIRRGPTSWISGKVTASQLVIGDRQVVGAQQSAIANPSGGSVSDAEGRAAVAAILAALRSHGLIAT